MFYENFKSMCDREKTTPTTVLKSLGMSTGSLSNWKRGAAPSGDILMRLAKHFGVSTDCLLNDDLPVQEAEHPYSVQELLSFYNLLSESEQKIILHKTAEMYYESKRQEELKSKQFRMIGDAEDGG